MIGLIMGWLLARAGDNPAHRVRGLVLAWAIPALLHFAYDLPLGLSDIDAYRQPGYLGFAAVNVVQCLLIIIRATNIQPITIRKWIGFHRFLSGNQRFDQVRNIKRFIVRNILQRFRL